MTTSQRYVADAGSETRSAAARNPGVAHHFGTRDALLEALLRHGGRRIREAFTDVHGPLACTRTDGATAHRWHLLCVRPLLWRTCDRTSRPGWRDKGGGMPTPVVDALQNRAPLEAVGGRRVHRHSWPSLPCLKRWQPKPHTARHFAVAPASAIPPPVTLGQMTWWASTIVTVLGIDDPAGQSLSSRPAKSC
jgi:hypothetical protein